MNKSQRQKPGTRKRFSTGGAFLTISSAEIISQGASLARGIIVARIIGAEQIGIAMTMLLFGEFLNKMTNMNPGITLVQDPAGGSRGFRHTLQSILLIRGVVYSILIFLLAWPLAWFFEQQHNVIGFMAVAILPLLAGCLHIDVFRQMRNRNYVPVALLSSIPNIVSLAVTIVLSIWLQTFWLPILARLASSLTGIVVSIRVAKRRFGLCLDNKHLMRIIKFIIPLAGAGIIVFFSTSGPRLFLASAPRVFGSLEYTMFQVGVFAVAMNFCVLPSGIGSRIISQTWSPRMARMRDEPILFRKAFGEMQTVSYMLGAGTIVLLGASHSWMLLLYTDKFADAGSVVSVLSIFGGLRLGRVAMRAAALSTGRSGLIFWTNLAGLVGLLATIIAIANGQSLPVIASCLLLGEFCSFVVGNWLLTRGKLALRNSDLWIRPVVFCGIAILIATGERWLVQGLAPVLGVIISLVVTLLFFGVAAMINPSARRFLKQRGRPSR
jgi:O-antigen/teichoic acid export membrane protein